MATTSRPRHKTYISWRNKFRTKKLKLKLTSRESQVNSFKNYKKSPEGNETIDNQNLYQMQVLTRTCTVTSSQD